MAYISRTYPKGVQWCGLNRTAFYKIRSLSVRIRVATDSALLHIEGDGFICADTDNQVYYATADAVSKADVAILYAAEEAVHDVVALTQERLKCTRIP